MSKLEIKKCVLEILDVLYVRWGFDDWWDNLGDDIENEISTELESIIERRLNKEEKDNRIKELEEFLEDVIEHPYMCGSPIWEEGRKLLNKDEDE
jgi:hypothetical protein